MNCLPIDIQKYIGEYLLQQEICNTQFILKWGALQDLRFPLRFPVESNDNLYFCRWLSRWKHQICNLKSIFINYLKMGYRSFVFEILGKMNLKNVTNIKIVNLLSIFDFLSPRLLFALQCFFRKCVSTQTVYVDARLIPFCANMPYHAEFTTHVTIGSCVCSEYRDSRQTSIMWVHDLDRHVNIKCWCFQTNGICETMMRIPSHKRTNVTIAHYK